MKRQIELALAERVAARVVATLSPFVERIEVAGSVRRRKPVVGDVDIVAGGPSLGFETAIASLGGTFAKKQGTMDIDGVWVEIEVVPIETWGAAWQYRTGSKEENLRLRAKAKRMGLKLSQYGISDRETGRLLGGATEEEVYALLGEAYVPPERR